MLALVYLWLAICLGDRLWQRFYRFVSFPHRYAAAVIVGLVVSSWFTNFFSRLLIKNTRQPNANRLPESASSQSTIWCFQ